MKNEFFKKNSTTGSLELRKSYLHEFNDETERILELEYHEGNTSANLEYSRKKELIKTLMGDTLYYENSALANVGMLIYERDIVEYDERGNLLLYVELKNPSGYRVFSSTRIRDAYEYDEADRVINEKSFTYDVYGANFSPLTEKDIIYSINGKDSIEIIYQNWNEENQNWINMYKTDFFYNDEGYDTLILKSRIDIVLMPDWIYTYKIRSFVDSEGNDTLKQDYRWENDLQSWILTQENKYMYDEKNNIILTLQKNNENNSWDTVFRNEYIYNNVGEIIQKDEYNTTRKISSFYYDEYVLTLQYKWNNSEADWELEFQKEYYSDGSYKDLQYVNDSTKILSSNFFGYNSDGDLIRKETYSARDINENLYNMSPGGSQIWNFTYPNIENKEKTIMPRVKEMTFSNFFSPSPHFYYAKSQEYKKIASFDCLYPSSTVGWYINHKRIMYFSELKATQISVDSSLNMENQEISLKVYPNPAKDNVFIDMPKNIKDYRVIITSILGNEIMNVFNKSNIAIENLEPGQYLLSVESKDKIIYTQKLVIK